MYIIMSHPMLSAFHTSIAHRYTVFTVLYFNTHSNFHTDSILIVDERLLHGNNQVHVVRSLLLPGRSSTKQHSNSPKCYAVQQRCAHVKTSSFLDIEPRHPPTVDWEGTVIITTAVSSRRRRGGKSNKSAGQKSAGHWSLVTGHWSGVRTAVSVVDRSMTMTQISCCCACVGFLVPYQLLGLHRQ